MTLWIRQYWAEDDTASFYELDAEGWATRQAGFVDGGRRPVCAATLSEVVRIRDHGTIADMRAYEDRYGVLAEGNLRGWGEGDGVVVISETEFVQRWSLRTTSSGSGG